MREYTKSQSWANLILTLTGTVLGISDSGSGAGVSESGLKGEICIGISLLSEGSSSGSELTYKDSSGEGGMGSTGVLVKLIFESESLPLLGS